MSAEPSRVMRYVVALVRDGGGLLLLATLQKAGPWSCLGGSVDDEEDLADAACRHALADCSLTARMGPVLAELAGAKYRILYECGVDTTYKANVCAATVDDDVSTSPMLARWFAPWELAEMYLDEFATAAFTDLGLLLI